MVEGLHIRYVLNVRPKFSERAARGPERVSGENSFPLNSHFIDL